MKEVLIALGKIMLLVLFIVLQIVLEIGISMMV